MGQVEKSDYLSQSPQRTLSYNIFIRTGERFVLMKQLTLRVKLLDNNVTETWFPNRGTRDDGKVQLNGCFCVVCLKIVAKNSFY